MAINKKITELSTKILDPDDIFIIADSSNNYQITMADISGALVGSGPPAGESTYSYFSEFINNVGSVTIKEYDAGGNILQKVISDDFSDFKAYLNWDGPGAIDYRGTGYIEDQEILIANTQETVVGSRNFAGFIDSLDVSTNTPLQLSGRANGQISILNLELAGPAPLPETVRIQAIDQSSSANKIDIYPGDTINTYAWFDFDNHTASEEPFEFRISNPNGDLDFLQGTSFTEWNQPWLTNHPSDPTLSGIMIQGTVNNVSDTTIEHGVSVECRNRFGKISATSSIKPDRDPLSLTDSFQIDAAMSLGVDTYWHSHLVGKAPEVNIINVEYPGKTPSDAAKVTANLIYDQQAIKAGDSALVENNATDFDNILYESPNGELTIESPTVYEQFKKVTYNAGSYNINTNNFKITATKSALATVKETVVKIANTPLELDIKNLASKIKSSPSGNSDAFALQSNQLQLIAPTLEADPAQNPQSPLSRLNSGTGTTGNNFSITVRDADEKGTFTWQNIFGVNLAGVETTTVKAGDENYTIEGFVSRQISASAFTTWKGLYRIGTTVTNPNNVSFYSDSIGGNLSFHDLGVGTTLIVGNGDTFLPQYNSNPGNLPDKRFAIVTADPNDPFTSTSITVDPNGNFLYILDAGIRGMNNFGSATGDIEEN